MLKRLENVLFAGQIQYASLFAQIIKLNILNDPFLREIFSDISQHSLIVEKQIAHLQEQGRIRNKCDPDEIVSAVMALAIGLKVLSNLKGWDLTRIRQIWENTSQLIVCHPPDGK